MPASLRTERDAWIDAGLRALAAGGPDAVRIEPLAEALGVTKGGFYWQWANRPAFLEELLGVWERRMVDEVVLDVDETGGDARRRLRRLAELAGDRRELVRVELAVRDWARRDDGVARRLRRVDDRRMDYLRALFAEIAPDPREVEARALLAMALFVGVPFVAAAPRGRRRAGAARDALELLLR